jgi:hypothetical protein
MNSVIDATGTSWSSSGIQSIPSPSHFGFHQQDTTEMVAELG